MVCGLLAGLTYRMGSGVVYGVPDRLIAAGSVQVWYGFTLAAAVCG